MSLIRPKSGGYVGGLTTLEFDAAVKDFELTINGASFHSEEGDAGPRTKFTVDLNDIQPDTYLSVSVSYVPVATSGVTTTEAFGLWKPRHDLGGMGATVIGSSGKPEGVFFKFWLQDVQRVFVRGSFNGWRDTHRLDQLGDTGYWFGFCGDARPGDDYRFFVYGKDRKFDEVSDPAARQTMKTPYNSADAQDANAVVVDPRAFVWAHDGDYAAERRDVRRMLIYQAHIGTFLREGTGLPFATFVTGADENAKRAGVRTSLSYLTDLGFTAIELLPIHEANGDQNAGYDPSFFFAVENAYGLPDDLRIFVDEAHGLGLSVIFDSVINHLTADLSHSSFSQEFIRGWYVREDAPWSNHKQWGGLDWGPDPDFDRYPVRNLLADCMVMYAEEYHIDGIRFDATTTIPRDAMKDMIGRLRNDARTAQVYLIAEHLTDDPLPYIVGDVGFHAGWDKAAHDVGMGQILQRVGRGDLSALRKVFESNYQGRPESAIKYITGSHDEVWVARRGKSAVNAIGGAANYDVRMKMRLGWSLNVCALGTPMMFMGTECLDDRPWDNAFGYGDMVWRSTPGSNAGKFKEMMRTLHGLRKAHAALRGANIDTKLVHVDEDNGVIAYKRWDQSGGVFLIVINISDHNWGGREYQVYTDTPGSSWHECFNSQYVNYDGWTGACNSEATFFPSADGAGLLQGINVAKWCLLILKKQ